MIALVLAGLVSGCFNRDPEPIYVDSEEVDPIEVPEGMTEPPTSTAYRIPGTFLPELAATGDEALPPQVLPSSEAEASRSHIRFGPTGLYLEVEDEPDSVWRRLSFTLNRQGMTVRRIDEPDRRYLFEFTHEPIRVERSGLARLAFWRSTEVRDYSGQYLAEVRPEGDQSRVVLFDRNGQIVEMDRAEYVLAVLRDRLG
jgi:uncharacterized lipoprotein